MGSPNPQRTSRILALYEKGVKLTEIAEREGLIESSITHVITRFGVANRHRPYTQELIDKVVQMHSQKMHDTEIAEQLGESVTRIKHLRRVKLRLPGYLHTSEKAKREYAKTVEKVGHVGKRRWDSEKFSTFVAGAPIGVTPRQFDVMKIIHRFGLADTNLIAKHMRLQSIHLWRHLRYLREHGHIVVASQSARNRLIVYRLAKPLLLEETSCTENASKR